MARLALVLIVVLLAGCAEEGAPATPAGGVSPTPIPTMESDEAVARAKFVMADVPRPPADPIPTSYTIHSADNKYWRVDGLAGNNPTLTVPANTTVTLTAHNADQGIHNIRVGTGPTHDVHEPDQRATVTFEVPGGRPIEYICTIHASTMKGNIVAFVEPVVHTVSLPRGSVSTSEPMRVGEYVVWRNTESAPLSVAWSGDRTTETATIAAGGSVSMRLAAPGVLEFTAGEGASRTTGSFDIARA